MQLQPAIIFARHFYISNAIKASHRYMTPNALSILIRCISKDLVQISRFLYSTVRLLTVVVLKYVGYCKNKKTWRAK
jgi:hypothetical protein